MVTEPSENKEKVEEKSHPKLRISIVSHLKIFEGT